MKHPYPTREALMAIAIAYINKRMIADLVLPRMPVGKSNYTYMTYGTENFNIVDTLVGRRGTPGNVQTTADELPGIVKEYGLGADVPWGDIVDSEGRYDPVGRAVTLIQENIALGREKRVADLVQTAGNFGGNVEAISGTDMWNTATGNPLVQLKDIADSMFMYPTHLVLNRAGATALQRNPFVVKAFNGTSGDSGLVPLSFIRDMLDLQEIVIGEARMNGNNMGQAPTITTLWGGHATLMYQNPQVGPSEGLTFGWTAEWGTRIAETQEKKPGELGLDGGVHVITGERVDEKIVANDCGYLITGIV